MTIVFLFLFTSLLLQPHQEKDTVKVYWEVMGTSMSVFVQNENVYPVTIEFSAELLNIKSGHRFPVTEVIEASSNKNIVRLQIQNPTKISGYKATYQYYQGDIYAEHSSQIAYRLPFKLGSSYRLTQGFNGAFTHQGDLQYALDFHMDIGTEVYVARSGIVIEVVDSNDKGGLLKEYMPYVNYITILHDDGTFADYSHLKLNGALVVKGQKVSRGQLIGYSGSTGFSSGPHLHFVVKKAKKGGGFISIPVKFATKDGIVELKEGFSYAGY